MLRYLACLLLLVVSLEIAGCKRQQPTPPLEEHKVSNVLRLVHNGGGEYAIYTQDPGSTEIQKKYLRLSKSPYKIHTDVDPQEKPYLLLYKDKKGKIWKAAFHLRSLDDLGGKAF